MDRSDSFGMGQKEGIKDAQQYSFSSFGQNLVPTFSYHPHQSKSHTKHPSTPPTSSNKSPTKTNPDYHKRNFRNNNYIMKIR
jgi:hypothetical protein